MLKPTFLVLLLALSGCAVTPGCYVGVSIFPPGPFVHCGLDMNKSEPKDEEEYEINV